MTDAMGRSDIEDTLWRTLKVVGDALSMGAIADIALLIRVGEHLVAYETLATQAYEFSVGIDVRLVADLRTLGFALAADPKYGDWLGECAVSG